MSFKDEYKTFINNTGEIAHRGICARNFKPSAEQKLQDLLGEVISDLLSEQAVDAVANAASQKTPRSIDLFTREMEFFNDQYELDDDKDDDNAGDDAKNLKDSAESLLGDLLPDWLSDLLDMLNELLSFGSRN